MESTRAAWIGFAALIIAAVIGVAFKSNSSQLLGTIRVVLDNPEVLRDLQAEKARLVAENADLRRQLAQAQQAVRTPSLPAPKIDASTPTPAPISVPAPPPGPGATEPPTVIDERQTPSGAIKIGLVRCATSGSQLACDFLLTATKDDQKVSVFTHSRIIGAAGDERTCSTAHIGERETSSIFGSEARVTNTLVANIPMQARLTCPAWPGIGPRLALLELALLDSGRHATIQYRGVQLD